MQFPAYQVCRFCSERAADYRLVKYGVRHYAHHACYLDAGKTLDALPKWKVESFPFRLLRERGLEADAARLTREG